MQQDDFSPLVRFLQIIPKSGDIELTLLKTHLVIEEVLTKIICNACQNEKYVLEAKLQFHQKIKLTRALGGLKHSPWIWRALELLNKARNELSHNLTPDNLATKIELFTSHVKSQNKDLFKAAENEKFTHFHIATAITYAALAFHAKFDPVKVQGDSLLANYA